MIDQAQSLGDHSPHPQTPLLQGFQMNLRFIDWLWNIRGSVPLPPGQSGEEAFARLDPLLQQPGTRCERSGETLVFTKKDQAAQDRMSIFDAGALQIEQGADGAVLRYRLYSRALLFCLLAPLLFIAFGQMIVGIGVLEGPPTEAELKAEKAKQEAKDKKVQTLNPIDQFLGAPAPEKPKKDEKDKAKDKAKDKKHSPTAAYVFAAIFAVLFVAGRILEDWLIRKRLRQALHES